MYCKLKYIFVGQSKQSRMFSRILLHLFDERDVLYFKNIILQKHGIDLN